MSFVQHIAKSMPELRDKLRMAGIHKKPEAYIRQSLVNAFFMALMVGVIFFILNTKLGLPIVAIIIAVGIITLILFFMFIRRVDSAITKRAKEIDKDVLFAGRFLLVKLSSGRPLVNSIIDASNSYGVASNYFKEIVRDIELGTPIEEALDNAIRYSPSKRFKRILFQINNALKIGIDVTKPLEAILDEINQEQMIEIQRYGKKLNSLTMFYMLLAIIAPSLGITLFSIIASMLALKLDLSAFIIILFFLAIAQLFFLNIFKSIRPNINI